MCANQGSQNLLGKKLEKDGGKQALGKLQSGLLETTDADQITASQLGARQVLNSPPKVAQSTRLHPAQVTDSKFTR